MAAYRGCEICKQPIETDRAADYTATTLCVRHAQDIGNYGGEFRTIVSEDSRSKKQSIKVTISGVTTEMVRNERAMQRLKNDYEAQQFS